VLSEEDRRKKAAVQRSHAWQQAWRRYGLRFDHFLYAEVLERIGRALAGKSSGKRTKVMTRQAPGVYLVKIHVIDEWMYVVYDAETRELRTCLPAHIKHIKGYNVQGW
jgi:hypothetical protein